MIDTDNLLAAIQHRRSMGISRILPNPVDRIVIERMLEAANWGQSHGDTEPWRFVVFMGEGRHQLADHFEFAFHQEHPDGAKQGALEGYRERAFSAPVSIALVMQPSQLEDGSLKMSLEEELMAMATAIQNLHLMASAQGLAGMWHSKGLSVSAAVAESMGFREPAQLLGFFRCGWPSSEWPAGERGDLANRVEWVE